MSLNIVEVVYAATMILLTAGLLLFARVMYARLSRFDVDHELTEADNPAIGTAMFGYLLGVVFVLLGLLSTELQQTTQTTSRSLAWDLGEMAVYGVVSIFLLRLSGWINDRFILHSFENKKELVDDRNVGVGAVLCGTYIASGLVLAGALSGRVTQQLSVPRWELLLRELSTAVVFYLLGQLVLVLYGMLYQRLFKHDPLEAIERDYEVDGQKHGGNAAAGIAMGGNMVAIGIILWGGTRGDFVGWGDNLIAFAIVVGVGLVVLPLWRIFVDRVLLGKANMADEIYRDRNPNAALLETVACVAVAIVVAIVTRPDLIA